MEFPIVISENSDLTFFGSTQSAERQVEAIDVLNEEYIAFDASGRKLRLAVDKAGRVSITRAESEPAHAEDLRRELARFLMAVDRIDLRNEDLASLIAKCERFVNR